MGFFSIGKNKINPSINSESVIKPETALDIKTETHTPEPTITDPVATPEPIPNNTHDPISAPEQIIRVAPMRDIESEKKDSPVTETDRPFSFFGDNILGARDAKPLEKPEGQILGEDVEEITGFIKQEKSEKNAIKEKLNPTTKEDIMKSVASQMPYQVTSPEGKPTKRDANEISLVNLRTYEDDIKFAVRNQNMTRARMLMAEQKQKDDNQELRESGSLKKTKNKILLFITTILIVGGIGVAGYFLFVSKKNPLTIISPGIEILKPTFIDVDLSREIIFAGRVRKNITDEIDRILETPFTTGKVREILLTKEVQVGELKKRATISSEEFLNFLETHAPDSLVRAFGKDFMFGVYSATETANEPFILFKVNDFQNAFAGMLTWESDMARDLSSIFKQFDTSVVFQPATSIEPALISIASSTESAVSTTTPPTPEPTVNYRVFVDQVILNQDVRSILDKDGKVIFMYSFINEQNLIIVNNRETLEAILVRMRTANLIR